MKIVTQPHGHVTTLEAHGPLTAEELIDLRRAIEEVRSSGARRVVVDMRDVPYVDSAGIELLLEMTVKAAAPHQRPKFAALSETCREALDLTDVLRRIEVFDTVDNALRSCQR